jgi:hypothetical protein
MWGSRETDAVWTVYDPVATTVRSYAFPERFQLRDVWGSSPLGVLEDSLDVSYVATLQLNPGGKR